jgi:large subunit ribosomal protein L34
MAILSATGGWHLRRLTGFAAHFGPSTVPAGNPSPVARWNLAAKAATVLPFPACSPDAAAGGPVHTSRTTDRSAMHYPRRVSNTKRVRNFGFRARMKTKNGRKMINRKRRMGRRLSAV